GQQGWRPAPLPSLRPDIPPELERVVGRMLAKSPAQRHQTPAEVAQALAAFTGPGASAGQEQAGPGAQPPRSGRRWVALAGGLGGAAALAGPAVLFPGGRGGGGGAR